MRADFYIARALEQTSRRPESPGPSQVFATVWPVLFFVAVVAYSIVEAFI